MPRKTKRREGAGLLGAIAQVTRRFAGWAPPAEVLTEVRSFPTPFPQFDVATRVGGMPLQRAVLVHGPSNHGKTLAVHGFGMGVLQAGGIYNLVDAEYTTDVRWLRAIMGDLVDHPGFCALRPTSYEATIAAVRSALSNVIEAKASGELPDSVPMLIAVDSIKRLVPENILAKLQKAEVTGGADGMSGRAAQMMAAMNEAWLRELVPVIYQANATFLVITRESENVEKRSSWDVDWKLQGGKALQYDSSLTMRVQRAGFVKEGEQEVGERHRVTIRKTKVGPKDARDIVWHFHSSNGKTAPEGLDRVRDVVDMALTHGVLRRQGKAQVMDVATGEVYRSENAAVKALRESEPEALQSLAALAIDAATKAVSNGASVAPPAPQDDLLEYAQ